MENMLSKTKKMIARSVAGAAVLPLLVSCGESEKVEKPMNISPLPCPR